MNTDTDTENGRNALVVKANALVPALAKMQLMELRLLAYCISKIERDGDSFCIIKSKLLDISRIFELPEEKIYGLIKSLVKRLNSNPAEYKEDEYDVVSVWFTTLRHKPGEIIFKMNEDLKPYLLQLKENFTSYRIKDIYQFKSASTWHVYEVLRQYLNQKTVEFDLDKFKALTGTLGLYSRWNNFKARILDSSVDEINTYSDIEVQYVLIKNGAKVSGIKFHIIKNKSNLTPSERIKLKIKNTKLDYAPELAKLLRDNHVAPNQAKQIANLAHHNRRVDETEKLIPLLTARYDAGSKKSTKGAYIFKVLKDERTKGRIVVDD